MKKTLATILCLTVALLCGGANYYRELLLLPRTTATATASSSGLIFEISTNGWDGYLTIPNMPTNGSFAWGFTSTTNYLTNAMMTLTVASYGYDDTGSTTTITRTVLGTRAMRLPYPAVTGSVAITPGTDVVVVDTTNAKFRVSLDDYIYTNETVTGVAIAGLYSSGGTNTPAGTIQVSNGSTQTVARTIANWSYPGFQRITNTTFQLRAIAFHRSAQQGRPVRVVKFWADDNQGHSNTQYVTGMSVSAMDCDRPGVAISEYIATMNASTFAQAATVTCHFAAYPWVGGSGSVCDTSDGVYTNDIPFYTPFYAPQTWICDTGNLWGVAVAVVNTNGGSDTAGTVVKFADFDTNSPPSAFATIAGAANKMQSSNSAWFGRADCGAGKIYLQPGFHSFPGGAASAGAISKVWMEVEAFPGLSVANCILTNYGGSGANPLNRRVKITNCTLSNTAGYVTLNCTNLWINNCVVGTPAAAQIGGVGVFYTTGTRYDACGQGLIPYSSGVGYFGLIRGCLVDGLVSKVISIYVTIGNLHTNMAGSGMSFSAYPSTSATHGLGGIFAYNKLMAMSNVAQRIVNTAGAANRPNGNNEVGLAIVQNLVEEVNAASVIGGWFAADTESNTYNNVILWHNTTVGCRWNMNYNDTGTNAYSREQWSVVNNWVDAVAQKSDLFANVEPDIGYSGNRVGNWPNYNGVGASGNYFGDCIQIVTFLPDYIGQNGFISAWSAAIAATNFFPFVNRASTRRATAPLVFGTGNGDYHITNCPIQSARWVLPYDLDGNPRTAAATNNQIGCYK